MKRKSRGVSPVVGVLLILAVTVALVSLTSYMVLDILNDTSESPDVSVEVAYYEDTNELTTTVVRNENADEIFLSSQSLESDVTLFAEQETGSNTVTVSSGTYFIIADVDGTESVIQKITIK